MPTRYAIEVVYPSGETTYLRHGSRIGEGPIATFATRKLADINRDFIAQGLDRGTQALVVRYTKDMK
jgi:hypothetical protein